LPLELELELELEPELLCRLYSVESMYPSPLRSAFEKFPFRFRSPDASLREMRPSPFVSRELKLPLLRELEFWSCMPPDELDGDEEEELREPLLWELLLCEPLLCEPLLCEPLFWEPLLCEPLLCDAPPGMVDGEVVLDEGEVLDEELLLPGVLPPPGVDDDD